MKASKPIVMVALSLLVSSAQASSAFDEGFYRSGQLPAGQVPANLKRAEAASVKLEILGDGHCSAAMISEDGYALTAAHCVERCLLKNKIARKTKIAGTQDDWYLAVSNQQPTAVQCPNLFIPEIKGLSPKLVFVGRGYNGFDDRKVLDFTEEAVRAVADTYNDFAILKFDLPNPVSCVPAVLDADPRPGSRIWAIGFPGKNGGRKGFASNGQSEYASYGRVVSGLSENDYFQNVAFASKAPAQKSEAIARLARIYGGRGLVLSDMDIYPGNSGSMAVDEQGRLIGVNTSIALPDTDLAKPRFYSGTGVSLSLASVTEEMTRHGVSGSQLKRMFNCSAR